MARVPFVGSRQFYTDTRLSESLLEQKTVSLRRTLPLFFFGHDLDWLLRRRGRSRGQEERAIVTTHAGMAPYNLDEEETAHFIPPRFGLGRIDLTISAIRTVLQSNPPHENELLKKRAVKHQAAVRYSIPSRDMRLCTIAQFVGSHGDGGWRISAAGFAE
jgi:hypothetical protein